MNLIRTISRLLVGFVFIFSGFVKGVDPLGTAFKIEDYLIVYGMDWLIPLSLAMSIVLCAIEFVLGVYLVLNVKPVSSSWLLLFMMSFFTLLTLYDAIYEPVSDCGCFGDAIKLSNWETFYKNVVLMVPTILLFVQRNKLKTPYRPALEWSLAMLAPIIFVWFSVYNYRNLPMIDFLAWKVGNKMIADSNSPLEFYLTFRNKNTGETQEFLSPNYPFNDAEWMLEWEFVSQRIIDSNPAPEHNLQILDQEYNDVTEHFIANPGYQFILAIWDVNKVNRNILQQMNNFYHQTEEAGFSFMAIAPTLEEGEMLREELQLDYEFYFADDVELKIMIRSNPGLIVLKDGVVLAKWSHRNFPEFDSFVSKFVKSNN